MTAVPRWRIAAGIAVLVAMAGLLGVFTPIYFHNLQLQNFVGGLTQAVDSQHSPDAQLRAQILQRAHTLGLPVTEDNVQISRSPGTLRIDVRYLVPVQLPGYAVNLHFYPGAGSRP
ncbi:MAG: hypothetical protein P4L56_16365 [Candidatus Sulfopaludibacter sp.]|nr:hypothetical protein [Candidatus Sulfopaludibacter sp.]